MRRLPAIAAVVVLAAGGVMAGCGASDEPTSAVTAPAASTGLDSTGTTAPSVDPQQAVSDAYAALRADSYVSTGTTTQEVDARGLDASVRGQVEEQFAAAGARASTTTRFASPERVAITQEIGGRSQQVVLYDGAVYVSPDGSRWAQATGDAAAAFSQATAISELNPASLFTGITRAGAGEVAGMPATRYTGRVDVTRAGEAAQSVIGGLGALGSAVGEAVSLRSGTVDVLVDDATGTVARQDLTIGIALDFGALARAAGQDGAESLGSVIITSTGAETITDAGGGVTVTKPTPSTTVSSVIELGEFLSS